jgi:hypothetical protein
MANPIVQVNVSVQVAPTPPTLQKTGCFVSVGGTVLSPQASSFLTQESDLIPLLRTPEALTSLTFSSGTVTAVASLPHNLPIGQVINLTVAGALPMGYNGTFPCTITTTSDFTYALPTSPGTETTPGTWISGEVNSLVERASTFFGQGFSQGIFVLELGSNGVTPAVAVLSNYLTMFPNTSYRPGAQGFFYIYLVPRSWDGNQAFIALATQFESPTARTYFWTTTTLNSFSDYTPQMKSILTMIENPVFDVYPANALTAITSTGTVVTATTASPHGVSVGATFQIVGVTPAGYNGFFLAQPGTTGSTLVYNVPAALGAETALGTLVASLYASSGTTSTEFSLAAPLQTVLNLSPSSVNRVTQLDYAFLFGVTPFISQGTNSLTTTLENAFVNYVGTGAEGGISQAIIIPGTTMDGNDFSSFWYSVDWVQINADINVANAVINGSNNPVNPLYYDQAGINALQAVIASTMNSGISFGLVNGTVVQTSLDGPTLDANINAGLYVGMTVVNAVPFITYSEENPGDYKIGRYAGFSIIYVPQLGFAHIVIDVIVEELIAQMA